MNSPSSPRTPGFQAVEKYMHGIVFDHPESEYVPVLQERHLYKRLKGGPRIQFSLADEGGLVPGTEGNLCIGRFSLTDDGGWHVYDMFDDGRIWNYESALDPAQQTAHGGRWLDETEITTFYEYLDTLNEKIWDETA